MTCCVKNCKSVKRLKLPDSQISFHRIAKDNFSTYMNILGLKDGVYKQKYICSLHFVDADFVISQSNRKFLKKVAIPSRNIGGAVATPSTSQETIEYWRIASEAPEDPLLLESPFVPIIQTGARSGRCNSFECYPPGNPSESGSSTDSEESSNERRRQLVKAIHNYSASPRAMKRKWEESQKKLIKSSKQLYAAKRTIVKLKQRISSLKGVIKVLKKQRTLQHFG